jgi:catechol 2,3-dioxygenase-like lactoylglutathione lyase family enzyme
MIKGLHHNAYRRRDSEETRGFYEDFFGLRFVSAFELDKCDGNHIRRLVRIVKVLRLTWRR